MEKLTTTPELVEQLNEGCLKYSSIPYHNPIVGGHKYQPNYLFSQFDLFLVDLGIKTVENLS
jgi:carboxylesterase type B